MRRVLCPSSVLLFAALAAACSVGPWGRHEQVAMRAEPGPSPSPPAEHGPSGSRQPVQTFTATAYTVDGITASGRDSHEGFVAADPAILPLGTRIRVSGAGKHSGVYVVKDTGPNINGREIDIFIANDAEAKRFGKKRVQVEVLSRGNGKAETEARADHR